ncbi:PREDICTED: uncharacterized protein LOC104824948 [Tarenaya hassleriana]|uniref:uncharacterized protein LOC104824948 n=1 Tax=Tarenaya hassleriana TaxID=28532 RepID=UPI00053C1546|nr:PREDICTED: uncharacterized protein LOC104824948 [Tarenaya hassleriana]
MAEKKFSGESEKAFSETEMEAAEQLVQLSEEETTVSCSSSCSGVGHGDKTRHEDVSSRTSNDRMVGIEQNGAVRGNIPGRMGTSSGKKTKRVRSLESIYRATKKIRSS